jgi:integrating conjugative element protein (TIGR03749 family)
VIKLLIVLITLLNLTSVNAELRLLSFPGETIKLMLDVDQEVQLNFEKPLSSIGIPTDIKNNIKTQLIDSRIWIKATKAFKPTRVLIKSLKGEISVFSLSATLNQQKAQEYPVKYNIVSERRQAYKSSSNKKNTNTATATATATKAGENYIALTRFVAQSFYAPKRLIKKIDVVRVPINTNQLITLFSCSKNLACNGNVSASPLASWKSSHYYISAVLLKNTTRQQIVLDPRDLLGKWKSATFHFNRLGRTNSLTDTTVVYLISSSPFEQSL